MLHPICLLRRAFQLLQAFLTSSSNICKLRAKFNISCRNSLMSFGAYRRTLIQLLSSIVRLVKVCAIWKIEATPPTARRTSAIAYLWRIMTLVKEIWNSWQKILESGILQLGVHWSSWIFHSLWDNRWRENGGVCSTMQVLYLDWSQSEYVSVICQFIGTKPDVKRRLFGILHHSRLVVVSADFWVGKPLEGGGGEEDEVEYLELVEVAWVGERVVWHEKLEQGED